MYSGIIVIEDYVLQKQILYVCSCFPNHLFLIKKIYNFQTFKKTIENTCNLSYDLFFLDFSSIQDSFGWIVRKIKKQNKHAKIIVFTIDGKMYSACHTDPYLFFCRKNMDVVKNLYQSLQDYLHQFHIEKVEIDQIAFYCDKRKTTFWPTGDYSFQVKENQTIYFRNPKKKRKLEDGGKQFIVDMVEIFHIPSEELENWFLVPSSDIKRWSGQKKYQKPMNKLTMFFFRSLMKRYFNKKKIK